MVWIGLDDTDNAESRGTGSLARQIANDLAADFAVLGVTRHQLLEDPRVPCTKRNSCAAIHLDSDDVDEGALVSRVREIMTSDFQPGSDPGLCVATYVPNAIIAFGRFTQVQLVTQQCARSLAADHDIQLLGLGGDEDGVIGALAAIGLAAQGDDGRYVQVGTVRELTGLQPVPALIAAGVSAVQMLDGSPVNQGLVLADKLRPARRDGVPIAVVQWEADHWLPLKLN
ncbi:MAG: hypothetical protein MUO67_16215 [Anaerolineales bacterium]|jgi:tRNA(Ile2) C34 agmatinyltransferase TiaS|nr:hypothetical protein [Anaerolineales bacterium]